MKAKKTTFYGLKHKQTGKPLGFSFSSHGDADECVSVGVSFSTYDDNIWLVKSQDAAIRAKKNDTPWYNADYETPRHNNIDLSFYEVFSIEI